MRNISLKALFVSLLILAFMHAQIWHSFAVAKEKKVPVAFVGIHFQNITPEIQDDILKSITESLSAESKLKLIFPAEVQNTIGYDKTKVFLNNQEKASFLEIAQQLNVDYVFAGELVNNSRDPNRILLDGEIKRFHRPTQGILKFKLLSYYENLKAELIKFEKNYVDTINLAQKSHKSSKQIWPLVIIGGLAVAGILSFKTVGKGSSVEKEEPNPNVD